MSFVFKQVIAGLLIGLFTLQPRAVDAQSVSREQLGSLEFLVIH